jgi:hypothetical protein
LLSNIRKSFADWRLPGFARLSFWWGVVLRKRSVRSIGGIVLTGGNRSTGRNTYPIANLFATNTMLSGSGWYPCSTVKSSDRGKYLCSFKLLKVCIEVLSLPRRTKAPVPIKKLIVDAKIGQKAYRTWRWGLLVDLQYTLSNKNPSAWNFLSPEPEVSCDTVAIIIRVVLLSPYLRIRCVSLSSIHYNQSHRVYINRRQGNTLHTVHTARHPTFQHRNCYNRTDKHRQRNAVSSPDDGHKGARNMLRHYWLTINHHCCI